MPIILVGIGHNRSIFKGLVDSTDPVEVLGNQALDSIRKINNIASLSWVRDHHTAELLKRASITCRSGIRVLPDPVGFMFHDRGETERNYIGVSLSSHEPTLRMHLERNLREVAGFLKNLSSTDRPILFLAFAPEERFIADLLERQGINIEKVIDTNNIDLLEHTVRSCKVLITQKMHPSIVAWGTETPFISINYDVKQINFQRLTKTTKLGIPINEVSEQRLTAKYKQMESYGLDQVSEAMKSLREVYRPQVSGFFDELVEVIRG